MSTPPQPARCLTVRLLLRDRDRFLVFLEDLFLDPFLDRALLTLDLVFDRLTDFRRLRVCGLADLARLDRFFKRLERLGIVIILAEIIFLKILKDFYLMLN